MFHLLHPNWPNGRLGLDASRRPSSRNRPIRWPWLTCPVSSTRRSLVRAGRSKCVGSRTSRRRPQTHPGTLTRSIRPTSHPAQNADHTNSGKALPAGGIAWRASRRTSPTFSSARRPGFGGWPGGRRSRHEEPTVWRVLFSPDSCGFPPPGHASQVFTHCDIVTRNPQK